MVGRMLQPIPILSVGLAVDGGVAEKVAEVLGSDWHPLPLQPHTSRRRRNRVLFLSYLKG